MTTDEATERRGGPRRGRILSGVIAFAVFLPIAVVAWFVRSDRSPSDSSHVFFPTWQGDARPAALVGGVLIEHDGCLFLGGGDGEELALWEAGYSYANGSILDAERRAVASLGDWIIGRGGYGGDRAWAEEITGATIPSGCVPPGPEPFVMVYDVAKAVLLPEVVGLTGVDATAKLEDAGLSVDVREHASDLVAGSVMEQDPTAGTSVAPGSSVVLVVSSGPAAPVSVGRLPQVGIAVGGKSGVTLIDVDGNVVADLAGYRIAGNPGAPGLWLQSHGASFLLDPAGGKLEPVSKDYARAHIYDEPKTDLPPPPGSSGGLWRFAFASPVGGATLAQWSGECEVPAAYWIDAQGVERIVTGQQKIADAPESLALGWTPNGEALVFLPQGPCSSGSSAPGVYRFTAPGQGRLIYRTGSWIGAAAEGWDAR